jgi:hypothetical protein
MLLGGLGDPGVHVGRLGRRQHDGLGQRQRVDAGLAHQLLQRQGLDAQVVLAAISCALARSNRACASRLSVMVACRPRSCAARRPAAG